ncbi:putative adipose-regulatory protein-domain-containing protein [Leucosporidium creatinivorum]|uniref:Putative adipose-regulatory protein-domain-containing protein n=1 Tax=Leucosporidium creatinivorum TaxID=106004 RepID=A0A1Y2E9S9_9BASI|nr:putative adipose-regulatory protein-domain-containing protein [Leucosporidium creatinivorum]
MARSRSASPRRPPTLVEQLSSFLPSPPLLLRSALLASILLLSVAIALFAWVLFYASLRTGSMGGRERVWLQYGQYQAPYANIALPRGKYDSSGGQLYDIQLEMTVPAVARNLDLGNFMVTLELRDQAGEALQKVSRPATLLYPAPPSLFTVLSPTRLLGSLIFPPSHTSSATTQRLQVPLLEEASLALKRAKTTEVFVRVGREDAHPSAKSSSGWTSRLGEVQVYEAWLTLSVRLRGLRYLTHRHPILLFLLFVPTFTLFELLAALIAWAVWLTYSKPPTEEVPSAPPAFPAAPGFPGAVKQEEDEDESLDLAQPSTVGVGPGLDPFARAARDDAEAARIARARALGVGARVGMMEMEGSETTETETEETGEMEETEEEGTVLEEEGVVEEVEGGATSEESWEGVEGEEMKDDGGTIGGSETTRGTRSSFGPSLAGTSTTASTSRSTATGSSSAGALRARVGAGKIEEEDDDGGGKGKGKARAD